MEIKNYKSVTNRVVEMKGAEKVKMRLLLTREDGADNFVMRMFEIAPGGHTPQHAHGWEHEIYVLDGQGTITFEGQDRPLSPGYALLVPGDKEHQFRCDGPEVLRFLCLVPAEAQG